MDNKQIDDIVARLDGFMAEGGGHMNVDFNNSDGVVTATPQVQTLKSNECAGQNMACKVPTLHIGIDDVEE